MKLLAVGVVPPPLSGQNYAFQKFIELICEGDYFSEVSVCNLSYNKANKNIFFKFFKLFNALFKYPIFFIKKNPDCVYLTPDSQGGRFLDCYIILFAKFFSAQFVVHHHSYGYINRNSGFDKFIYRLLKNSKHIFLSEKMKEDYFKALGEVDAFVMNNSYCVMDYYRLPCNDFKGGEGSLGMLSNLTNDKGVEMFLKISEADELKCFKFYLAGPCHDSALMDRILDVERKNINFEYLGSLTGMDKLSFYRNIDLFLFPSCYQNEAQPLVILEALSLNIPVISSNIGAISDILPNGYLVDDYKVLNVWVDSIKLLKKNGFFKADSRNSVAEMITKNLTVMKDLFDKLKVV